MKIPRSLAIAPPYRGRTIRGVIKKIPAGGMCLNALFRAKAGWIAKSGRRRLAAGNPEGRRFLTALPHPFCGIGHGFAEWHTAFQWAPKLGLEFVNTPMKEGWGTFLGVEAVAPCYRDIVSSVHPRIVRVPYVAWSWGREALPTIREFVKSVRSPDPLLFVLADAQNAYDHTPGAGALQDIFEMRGERAGMPRHALSGCFNVAVHLRRGDVATMSAAKLSNWRDRFVDEVWFVSVMEALLCALRGELRAHFHIYSQGKPEDFPVLRARTDATFYLDSDERETLFNMAGADALIMSPSGFSYLAALLNPNLKIARAPWWHAIPDTAGWIPVAGTALPDSKKVAHWIRHRAVFKPMQEKA
jgi:hypothetical protein